VKATITSELNISADDAWQLVKKSSTLTFVTKGLLSFSDSDHFPTEWVEDSRVVSRLRFFGIIPAWNHQIHFQKVSDSELEITTEEQGGIVSKWKHRIKISSINKGATSLYTDEVEIEAGLLTPVVWLYANLLYRYRQLRWKVLTSKQAPPYR
jgi:hypothetical protein